MRSQFSGYFDPTREDLEALWQNGAIALDTNVLLGLYRMPEASRKQVFDLLTQVRGRLWIPYHVVVEFHRNRLEAMRGEFASTKQLGKDVRNAYDAFKAVVSSRSNQERACWPQLAEKLEELNAKAEELFKVTKSESDHYVSPNQPDSVLAFVEGLLMGRVGSRPEGQAVVDEAEVAAKRRYAVNMGPGYLDQEKAGDLYMFDGLTYDRQYGDYMVWRELLSYSANNKLARLMLVTSDVKVDWWLDSKSVSGKRPQPELVMEMRREAGVECFWMYTLSDFIENAKNRLHAQISQRAITDARQTESAARREKKQSSESAEIRLRELSVKDIKTVLNDHADRHLFASDHAGVGVRGDDEEAVAVIVVPGIPLLFSQNRVLTALKTFLKMLDLLEDYRQVELYVMLAGGSQSALSGMAEHAAVRLLANVGLTDKVITSFCGHFLDNERTEYTFKKFG